MPLTSQDTNTPIDIIPTTFSITGVTFTSSTATYAIAGTLGVGSTVIVSDTAPDGYNGTFTVSSVVAGVSFTVANTTNATVTTGTGTAWQDPTDFVSDTSAVVFPVDNTDPSGNSSLYASTPPTATKVGDIWFDSSNGYKLYRWDGTTWVAVQDTAIAAAATAAAAAATAATAAQTTANGKNQVFRQGSTPTALAVGDVWFNTSNDNAISRWDGSSWVANTLGNNALASISASKITAGTIDASVITVSNLDAGNISTGYLAAARIAAASLNASVLIAGSITAAQIATGTITASQIASGTITASQIAAGTLSASNITTGTLSASVILAATSGTIGGITLNGSSGLTFSSGLYIDQSGNLNLNQGNFNGLVNLFGNVNATANLTASGAFYNATGYTTSSSANVFQNSSSGLLARVTSSQRYKVEILPEIIPVESVMSLVPKTWIDKAEYEANENSSNGLKRILGVIAEDVAQIPILKDFLVNYNEEGQPDSINYDRIAVALIPLIQNLAIRLETLESK